MKPAKPVVQKAPVSKIEHCFVWDVGGGMPVYDANPDGRTYFATEQGISSQTGKKRICVPLLTLTREQIEEKMILLLLEAVKDTGWKLNNPYEHAPGEFSRRGLELHQVLGHLDHPLIPNGWRLAITYPENVGTIVGGDGYWGELPGTRRGACLWNPDGVIGYKKRGKTAWKFVSDGIDIGP